MSTETIHPYTLNVEPCEKPEGHFQWLIRERGKLLQRSDRPHRSEREALDRGRAELERVVTGRNDRRIF